MSEGVPENSVSFFTQNGHDHDGENSTKLDLSKYDLSDIINIEDLEQRVRNIVNSGTLSPDGGIIIDPGVPGQPPIHLDPIVPGPATGLTAVTGVNDDGVMNIAVNWDPIDGAESYILQLYRSIDDGDNYLKVEDVVVKGISHEFNNLGHMGHVQTTVWKLIVQGQSTAGIVGLVQILADIPSAVDTVAPGAPTFTTGSGGTNFFLSFRGFLARLNEQTEGDTKWGMGQFEYSISTNNSSTSNFDSNEVESGRQTGRIISVTGLATGTPYYLRVRAYDNSNNYSVWTYWNGTSSAGSATVGDADSFTPSEITGTEITDDSITTAHILADQITTTELAADAVTADEIAANAVDADHIKANELFVGVGIESNLYSAGSTGFKINYDGTAEFNNNVTMLGATVKQSSFEVLDGSSNLLFRVVGSGTDQGNVTIYGNLTVGDWAAGDAGLNWNNSSNVFSIKGTVVATAGNIAGWTLDTAGGRSRMYSGAYGTDLLTLDNQNQYISVGDGAAVMRRMTVNNGTNLIGDVIIGIDASSANNPKYNTAGDIVMYYDPDGPTTKFSISNKLLFDGTNLTINDGSVTASTFQTSTSGARLSLTPVSAIVESETGTAQAGSSTTITLKSSDGNEDDYYNGWKVTLTSGTGSGQSTYIVDYDEGTKVATVSPSWSPTNPNSTSVYLLEAEQHTFLQGHTGDGEQDYPGFLFFYHDLENWANASSRHWGKVALSAPRYSGTFGYAGFNFGHSNDGRGSLSFGLPHNGDQFVIADTGSGSTPTNTFNRGGITIVSGTPASTNNTLYADGTTLKWHGAPIGGGSGVDSIIAGSNISVSGATGDVTVNGTYTAASPLTLSSGEFGIDTENITWASSTNMGISTWSGSISNADSFLVKNHTGNPNTAGSVYWFSLGTYLSNTNISSFINNSGYTANTGTVTSVSTSGPITGGTITSSGTIDLDWGSSHRMGVSSYTGVSSNLATVLVKDEATNTNGGVHWLSASSLYESIRFSLVPYSSESYSLGSYNKYWNYLWAKKLDHSAMSSFSGTGAYVTVQTDDLITRHSSSERIKKSITGVDTADALVRIKALRPIEFTPKFDSNSLAIDDLWEYRRHRGFIAEEVSAVSHQYAMYDWWASNDPDSEDYTKTKRALCAIQDEWTDEEVDDYYPLEDMAPIVPDHWAILADAVGAIQELEARLAALEA